MAKHRLRQSVVAVLTLVVFLAQGTWVLASPTGGLRGTVVDSATQNPIAGAKVSVISPSQSATTTADARGNFNFLTLAPDTYTVSAENPGYDATSVSGVTVFADQTQNLSLPLTKTLRVIGRVTSRAASDLIKPGTTADVYSISASAQAAAAPLGGGGSLNQAYSGIASVPGTFVPVGQNGWAQSVYVRGGNYNQLGYEYDGVPMQRAYDAYPASTLSALGQQELQVYTGAQPGSAQSSGLAGFVNQVIRTGTYPGFGGGVIGLGSPAFYHDLKGEFGGATPNRNLSYYVGTAGYNQQFQYVDHFNGASATNAYATFPYAAILSGCGTPQATGGCYNNGFGAAPNGYAWAPITLGAQSTIDDRETVANFHIGIPHPHDGGKDDIQALYSVSYLYTQFQTSQNDYGDGQPFMLGTGPANYLGQQIPNCSTGAATCAVQFVTAPFKYSQCNIYVGPVGTQLTSSMLGLVNSYPYPFSPTNTPIGGAEGPTNRATYNINDSIEKIQYTHQMGQNAYARIYGYSLYSDWFNIQPDAGGGGFQFLPSNYILPTHTRGLGLTVADQLGPHLINFTGGYSTATTQRWNNGFPSTSAFAAVLVNSLNPTGGCYTGAGVPAYCGSTAVARYQIPGTNTPVGPLQLKGTGAPVVGTEGALTCGTGPCQYLAVQSGLTGSINTVSPMFYNASLSDSWRVNNALLVDASLRYDSFGYNLPPGTQPQGPIPVSSGANVGTALFTNSYNAYHCFSIGTGVVTTATANSCPAGTSQVAFSNNSPSSTWYGGFEPRIGFTYTLNPLNVVRGSYGRYLQPSASAYQMYNRSGWDVAGYDVPKFYQYGFTSPGHYIPPAQSNNFDISWEHQVKGTDISWKLTPFLRRTQNESMLVVLDPVTNFVSAIPVLSENVRGFEAFFKKGDFDRDGFSGQLAFTYTYATAHYQTLPGGSSPFDNVNNQIKTYNAYTSFCVSNPTDSRCGSTSTGVTAAPCYDATGAPAACSAGTIANPYWNAPVQSLFNPNSSNYAPYNQTFGVGLSANASSYVVPYVATFIGNYKHQRFNITPSVQFTGGGKYGSPVMGVGMDPAGGLCTPLPAGYNVAGDPRYPYGAPGGAPFDAQSCAGFLTSPDPFTKTFDNLGAFTEPSSLTFNLGIGYQVSNNIKLNLLAVNVYGTCFGGTNVPWGAGPKLGCWYGAQSGFAGSNFYNPGNTFQGPNLQYPYLPVAGTNIAGQQAYGTNINPFQLFLSAEIKL